MRLSDDWQADADDRASRRNRGEPERDVIEVVTGEQYGGPAYVQVASAFLTLFRLRRELTNGRPGRREAVEAILSAATAAARPMPEQTRSPGAPHVWRALAEFLGG